ncbi:MAG: DUF3237 domain-containing protein [Parvularculales bacterium]
MQLVQEFQFNGSLGTPIPVGTIPIGTRLVYDIKGGEVSGERIRGNVLGGGEWALIGSDGFLRLDVRAQIETHDGAFLYMQYFGLLEMNTAVQEATASGNETQFGDQYFYTNPRIETGDERYAWVNTTFFIGEGRIFTGGGVEYRVWRPA